MEVEEIEAWYDEEKEKLTEDYKIRLEKGGRPDKLKRQYLKRLDSLHREYESKCKRSIDFGLKKYFAGHRLKMVKDKIMSPIAKFYEKYFPNMKKKEA